MLGWHIVMKLADESVIAADSRQRRIFARVVLRHGRARGLIAMHAPDNHGHVFAACDRPQAGQLAREIELALQNRLPLSSHFVPAYFRPVEDQRHAYNLFPYVLDQSRHHGVDDPFHDASNLVDLAGLRVCGRYTEDNVRRMLPRIRVDELLRLLGAPDLARAPRNLASLADAAAAALGLADLAGQGDEVVMARRAAIRCASAELSATEIGALLGIDASSVRRLRAKEPDPTHVSAIDLQLRLRHLKVAPTYMPSPADRMVGIFTAPRSPPAPGEARP